MTTTKWICGQGASQIRQRLNNLTESDHADFAGLMVARAGRLLEAGDIKGAEEHLRQGLEHMPDHPQCRAYLAICLAAGRRKFLTAEKLARNLLQHDPYDSTACYALGRIYLLGGKRREAFRYFAKAAALARGDRNLENQLRNVEPRRPPVLRFLPRDNSLNILLGRLRNIFAGS